MLLVVLVEIGSAFLIGGGSPGPVGPLASGMPDIPADMIEGVDGDSPPGSGIAYLVLIDGFLLFSVVMLGISLLASQRAYGRVQGIVTLVFSFALLIAAVAMAFAALGLLLVMVGLFVATPFGTIAYLAEACRCTRVPLPTCSWPSSPPRRLVLSCSARNERRVSK